MIKHSINIDCLCIHAGEKLELNISWWDKKANNGEGGYRGTKLLINNPSMEKPEILIKGTIKISRERMKEGE